MNVVEYEEYLYHKDGEWHYETGKSFVRTCVGFSTNANEACGDNLVCDGNLRTEVGTWAQQGELLRQALETDENSHPECMRVKDCQPATGLDYSPPVGDIQYQVCRDERGSCYYANDMYTCVCNDRQNIEEELKWAFQSFTLQASCQEDSLQSFDQLLDKQVTITDLMVQDLRDRIDSLPDVTNTLKESEEKLRGIWTNWETAVTHVLETAMNKDGATQESKDSIQELLDELRQTTVN